MQSQRRQQQPRFIVSQLLNMWVVRDTNLLKQKKRSIVAETTTKEDAERMCNTYNSDKPPSIWPSESPRE